MHPDAMEKDVEVRALPAVVGCTLAPIMGVSVKLGWDEFTLNVK